MIELCKTPNDLEHIDARGDQKWSVDEIGLDTNGKWTRIICTYKFCTVEKIWKTQTGERAPFWLVLMYKY